MTRAEIRMWLGVAALVAVFAAVALPEGHRAAVAEAETRRLIHQGWTTAFAFSFDAEQFDRACINRHSF